MGTSVSDFPKLTTEQYTSIIDHVHNEKPNVNTDYFIAFGHDRDQENNQIYKFVRVTPKDNPGAHGTSSVRFHTAEGNVRSLKKMESGNEGYVGTLDEFNQAYQAGQCTPIQTQGDVPRHSVVMDAGSAGKMSTWISPVNSYSLIEAIEKGDLTKFRKLLADGVSLNGICSGISPLAMAIQAKPADDVTPRQKTNFNRNKKVMLKELLKQKQTDPTIGGRFSALELAHQNKNDDLVKKLLVQSVKGDASQRRVLAAVNFCLKHYPQYYHLLSRELNVQSSANKLTYLTNIAPSDFHQLIESEYYVAKMVFHDMQKGCVAEAKSYKESKEAHLTAKVSQNGNSVAVNHIMRVVDLSVTEHWQYCHNCGSLLAVKSYFNNDKEDLCEMLTELEDASEVATCSGLFQSKNEQVATGRKKQVASKWRANVNGVDHHGKTLLMHAVTLNDMNAVHKILKCERVNPHIKLNEHQSRRNMTIFQKVMSFLGVSSYKGKQQAIDFVQNGPEGDSIRTAILRERQHTRGAGRVPTSDEYVNPPWVEFWEAVEFHEVPHVDFEVTEDSVTTTIGYFNNPPLTSWENVQSRPVPQVNLATTKPSAATLGASGGHAGVVPPSYEQSQKQYRNQKNPHYPSQGDNDGRTSPPPQYSQTKDFK